MFKLVLNNGFEVPLESVDVVEAMNEAKDRLTTDAGTVCDNETCYFGLVRLQPKALVLVLTACRLRNGKTYFSGSN